MADDERPSLHICVTCKREGEGDSDPPPGRALYDAVAERLAGDDAPPAELHALVCFTNCEQGCSAALSQSGKWSYMMGHLGPEHAADLIAWARAYAVSPSGTVLRSKRPDSLRHTIVARFPASPPAHTQKDAAE